MYFLNGALMWKSQIAISCYLMSADYLASIDYKYILNSDETSDYISLPIILLENAMNIDIIRPFSKGRITIFPIDRRLTCFSPFIQMKLILLNWYLEKYNCLFSYLILQAICQKSIFFLSLRTWYFNIWMYVEISKFIHRFEEINLISLLKY